MDGVGDSKDDITPFWSIEDTEWLSTGQNDGVRYEYDTRGGVRVRMDKLEWVGTTTNFELQEENYSRGIYEM